MKKYKQADAFIYYMKYPGRRAWDSEIDKQNSIQIMPFTGCISSAGRLTSLKLIYIVYEKLIECYGN